MGNSRYYSLVSDPGAGYLDNRMYVPAGELSFIQGLPEKALWNAPSIETQPPAETDTPILNEALATLVFQRTLRGIFWSADWQGALMSPEMKNYLLHSPPSAFDFKSVFPSPWMSVDPDLACKPRNR